MKVAVTGARGFIGRYVVEHALNRGHHVLSFDRQDGHDVLSRLDALEGADVVVHLAGLLGTAELFDDVPRAVEINITGTYNILKWCEENGAGYVGITMPQVFPSVYTATKVCAGRLESAWHMFRGVPVSRVRAFNAYGPNQRFGRGHPRKIVPTFSVAAWRGEPLEIWGDGTQTMDLIHAGDLGRILVDATQHGDDVTFDGGTGTAVSVNEFAEAVVNITGSDSGIIHLPMRDGEVPQRLVANGDGWDRLDWRPKLDWVEVEKTVWSYRDMALT